VPIVLGITIDRFDEAGVELAAVDEGVSADKGEASG